MRRTGNSACGDKIITGVPGLGRDGTAMGNDRSLYSPIEYLPKNEENLCVGEKP
jgi:hypothetical protein